MGGEPGCDQKGKGIYEKYYVTRADEGDRPNHKHYGCKYFVLDLTHDRFVPETIRTYGRLARAAGYGPLASDLKDKADAMEKAFGVVRPDMKVYQIQWDGQHDLVEAASYGEAIGIWRRHMRDEEDTIVEKDEWNTEEPEQVVLLSDKPVLR